jgi:hypothetical protein
MSGVRLTRRGEAVLALAAGLSLVGTSVGLALVLAAWWGLL